MLIHEMTEDECRTALQGVSFGRLGCARDDQPYVVPIYFAYDGEHRHGRRGPGAVYAFSALGQKIEWMRSNPRVCLEIDERASHNRWLSVVVFGRYEELLDTEEFGDQRVRAFQVLQERAMWWEPAYVATERRERSLTPVFYRIRIERMTGHRATPDPVEAATSRAGAPTAGARWLGGILRHWHRALMIGPGAIPWAWRRGAHASTAGERRIEPFPASDSMAAGRRAAGGHSGVGADGGDAHGAAA